MGVGESVYADTTTENTTIGDGNSENSEDPATGIDSMSLWQILNLLLKIIYIFIWPLLVIAGLALDNTLVYASIFNMDAPLWKFWNMMKNFANFALWFMVLFAIIKSIFTNSGQWSLKDEKSPLGIIKKTLIAGILIQASWFIMAVLVDLSTIATYAVGGLPLNILKNDPIGSMQIITVNSSINLDKFDIISAGGQWFDVWYTLTYKGTEMKVSPCRIEQNYIIGRVKWWAKYKHKSNFDTTAYDWMELCVLNGNTIAMRQEDELMKNITTHISPNWPPQPWSDEILYNSALKQFLQDTWWRDLDFVHEYAIKLWGKGTWSNPGLIKWDEFLKDGDTVTMQLSQLIDKSKWFVGPLVTIYSSLLNFAQLTDTDISSIGETSWIFIIKSWIALALFFPLLALAIVLIARIWLLWLFIVASPFLVLKESFSGFLKLWKLDEWLSIKSVTGIIFAPVVSVAALSLSLIFMTALLNGFNSNNPNDLARFEKTLWIEKIKAIDPDKNDAMKIWWAGSIEFTKLGLWNTLDRFSWLLVNFFAIGLMWMVVFAAIKSNKLWEKIWWSVEKFGANMFQTLPIIPMWEGNKNVGIGSMARVLADAPNRYLQNLETKDSQIVWDWLYGKDPELTAQTAQTIFSPNATNTTITEGLKKLKVKDEDIPTFISSNYSTIGATVAGLVPDERDSVVAAVGVLAWNTQRFEQYTKSALDTIAINIADQNTVDTFFTQTDPNNKKIIEDYFAEHTEYIVTTADNKQYKITQDPDNPTTYSSTEIIPQTPSST